MESNFCSRPFNEMHIEENGNVTPCCVMPSNRFFMGKGVKDYWYGARLSNLRNKFAYNIDMYCIVDFNLFLFALYEEEFI